MLPKKIAAQKIITEMRISSQKRKNFADEIMKIMDDLDLESFYFASPPDEKPFLFEIALRMDRKRFVPDFALTDFLEKEFKNCATIMQDFGNLVSLAEMELSYLSNLYLYSCFSTWSGNVLLERTIDGKLNNKINVDVVASALGKKYEGRCTPSVDPGSWEENLHADKI